MTTARAVIDANLVWDNHSCMPLRPHDESFLPQLERCRAAGYDMICLNIGFGEQSVEDHIRMLGAMRRWLKARPDDYVLVDTVADIDRARAEGKLAVAFDMEGTNGLSDQPSLVELYYDLGVRWMLIAYNRNNRVGGGCHDEDTGLTAFGRQVIDEMARVGMVLCCSHTGFKTTMDAMEYSSKPVIFSRSNPRAMHDHPRNITDEAMRACARTGGVVGINGIGTFLGTAEDMTEDYVRHMDYAVQLIGPEHVGVGFDYVFDQAELDEYLAKMAHTFPKGMGYEAGIRIVKPEQLEPIVERLLGLGYRETDLKAILGGNFRRVAEQVWRPA